VALRITIGSVVGGFRIEAPIAEGAMGAVYLAEDPGGRRVAVKLLAPALAEDKRFRERFLRESQVAAGLNHPNIVPTLASGDEDGVLYLAMAFIEGSDLRQLLRREGRLEAERALALVEQVADALDAAHAAGLVHRDVKPGNILVTTEEGREHAYVCDFGLARHVSSVSSLTAERGFVGTIDYVPPEQIEGKPIDIRADVYSLGCVLYECLAGERVFERETELSVLFAHLNESPSPITDVNPELPAPLDTVFDTALAKSPADRFATCRELIEAARAGFRGEPVVRRGTGRRRATIAVGALLLFACLAGLALVVATRGTSTSAPTEAALPLQADAVTLVDARTASTTGRASVGSAPSDIAFGPGSAWLVLDAEQGVTRVDPATGRVTGRVSLPFVPSRVASAGTSAWVTEDGGPHVARIGPLPGRRGKLGVIEQFSVPTRGLRISTPAGIAVGAGSLWLARGPNVARVDPRTGRVKQLFATPVTSNLVVFEAGSVWAASSESGMVYKIDPVSGASIHTRLQAWISDLIVGDGFVWVPVVPANVIYNLSPDDLSVQGQITDVPDPESVALGGDSLWVANTTAQTLTRISLPGEERKVFRTSANPSAVRYRGGSIWAAAVEAPPRLAPLASGQEIRIPLSLDDVNLDPAVPANAHRWQRDYATCATLLNYPDSPGAAGLELRPEIAAAMPRISPDGRTYTFRIRPGFRFSPPSGQAITAETFRYTLERAFSPAYNPYSPAKALLSNIVGAVAFNDGKTPHISGVSARGNILTIKLQEPDGGFVSRLSEGFFCPVPIGTPAGANRIRRPIASAGPYYMASHTPEQTVLLRNPNYHGVRPRRIERIVYTVGIPTAKAIALVDGGAADYTDIYTSNSDPTALGTTSIAARRYGPDSAAARTGDQRYFVTLTPRIDGIVFNTTRPLFSDPRVRRAASLAIDRRALARVFDEPPTDRLIPPGVAGYQSAHVYPLSPSVAAARRLMRPGRHRAVLYSCGPPQPVTPGVEEIIRSNLARIGIDVEIEKSLGCLNGPETRKLAAADIQSITIGDNWGDPAGTVRAVLEGPFGGAVKYWNEPVLAGRIERAGRLRGRARIAEFATLDEALLRAAPVAVFGVLSAPEYFSPRVGCKLFHATYRFVDLGALCIRPN
jgi:serine/threonine-protein kinase